MTGPPDAAGAGFPHGARVLIVDDHPLIRQGVARTLSAEPGLEVAGEAATAAEALAQASELEPDLVVLDLGLGSADGLDLIPRILRATGGAKVLVLSMFDEALYAERCLRAGASGYLMKEAASSTLVDAIREVLAGEIHVSEPVQDRLVRKAAGRAPDSAGVSDLTDRELQVFRMLGEGLSTREVAEGLHLSIKTVESHRAKIMRKLGLEQASQLIHRAVAWVQGEHGMP